MSKELSTEKTMTVNDMADPNKVEGFVEIMLRLSGIIDDSYPDYFDCIKKEIDKKDIENKDIMNIATGVMFGCEDFFLDKYVNEYKDLINNQSQLIKTQENMISLQKNLLKEKGFYGFSNYAEKNKDKSVELGFTYIAKQKNEDDLYKIGYSKDISIRERTLKTGNIFIEIQALLRTSRYKSLEKDLHKLLGKNRVRGEWFRLTKNELNGIVNLYGFTYCLEDPDIIEECRR